MNKKAQLDLDDVNWNFFAILCIVGVSTFGVMLLIWRKMNFDVGIFTIIAVLVGIPIASLVFTKLFGE